MPFNLKLKFKESNLRNLEKQNKKQRNRIRNRKIE